MPTALPLGLLLEPAPLLGFSFLERAVASGLLVIPSIDLSAAPALLLWLSLLGILAASAHAPPCLSRPDVCQQ